MSSTITKSGGGMSAEAIAPVIPDALFDETSPLRRRRVQASDDPLYRCSRFLIDCKGRLLDHESREYTRADTSTLVGDLKISHCGDQRGPGRRLEMFRSDRQGLIRVTVGNDVFWMLEARR